MQRENEADVLIVGAGPVGLTLAIDLAWRGIDVTIVERRHAGEPPEPKCNHVSARSMEIYRRLGVAAKLERRRIKERRARGRACHKVATRVSSLSLVRYRNNDYSVPTRHGHQEVPGEAC